MPYDPKSKKVAETKGLKKSKPNKTKVTTELNADITTNHKHILKRQDDD